MATRDSKNAFMLVSIFISLLIISFDIYALPEGESVAAGSAAFDRSNPDTLNINTPSDKLIVDYNSFSIAQTETVNFNQPSSSAIALNRVVGVDPSSIMGKLTANGNVFLINPNGVIFGKDSRVDVAGLVASTLNISNEDFLKGNYNFYRVNGKPNSWIINQGNMKISNGGYVFLLSAAIDNQGEIQAGLGKIVLASGEKMTVNLDDMGDISVVIDEAVKEAVLGPDGKRMDSAIKNSGTISANGGKVLLTAKSLNNVFDYAINNSGIIEAKTISNHNGTVELVAEGAPILNTGTINANTVIINTINSDFINKGEIISDTAPATLSIKALNIMNSGIISVPTSITLEAENAIIQLNPSAVGQNSSANPVPQAIIQSNSINLKAKQFGTPDVPLNIKGNDIYISRTQGDIEILDSLGIGTTILLRGPPDGFGAIVYNKDTNLTLDAERVKVIGQEPVYFYGNITFLNFECAVPDKEIYFEAAKTYIFKDTLSIIGAPDIGLEEFFIKLRSSESGKYWYLGIQADNYTLERVNISDAYAFSKVVIPIGVDAGNNLNFEIDPTWDGGGTTNNWSDAVNWSGNTLPTSTTDASFDATSTKDSTVDATFAGTIRDLLINAGYTGTITFSRSLSVRDFSQAAGTVSLGSQTLTVSRNFALSAGAFNVGSGNINIANNLTISGTGAFNAGSAAIDVENNFTISGTGVFDEGTSTVTFSGGAATINILTTETFYNLTFNATAAKTVSSGDTLIVTKILTLTDGSINTGTVSAKGDISQASTFDGGTGDLLIDGTSGQTFTGNATTAAGELPDLTINKSAGTLTLTGIIRTNGQGAGAWTYTAGTVDAGTSTVVFDGGMTITGSHTLKNVTFNNAGTRVIASGTTLTITGTFNYNDGTINTGTIAAQGDIIQGSASDGGSASAILQITGSADQLFTGNATTSAGELPDLTINKSAGTLTLKETIRINGAGAGAWTYTAGTVDATTNDSLVVFNGANTIDAQGTSSTMAFDNVEFTAGTSTLAGNLDVDGNLTISGGTLNTSSSDFSVNVAGNWSNSGTFTSNNSTVTLDGASDSTMDTGGVAAGDDFQALVISKSSGAVARLINNNLDVNGTLTINSGVLYLNGRNITTTASFVNNGTLRLQGIEAVSFIVNDTDSGTWEYVGRNIAETITLKDFGATDYFNLTVNDTNTNKTTFSSGAAKTIAGTFTVSSGTYNANGQTTTVTGLSTVDGGTYQASTATQTFNGGLTVSAGTFTGSTGTVDVNGDVTISGTGTLTAPTGTFTVSGDWAKTGSTFTPGTGTVTFDGTSAGKSITSGGASFNNITFNGVGGSWSLQDDLDVNGNLTLTNGTLNLNGKTITLAGNFSNNATFNHNSGTVTFDGAGTSTISGSTTFFNFTSTTAGKQLTFTAGSTQTIAGTLTLTGASGNLIVLRSSSTGNQWSINPQGTRSVSYVDVKDSNNTNATAITTSNSTNSGNNTNWTFVGPAAYLKITAASSTLTAGNSLELTITAYDAGGNIATSYAGAKNLTFSGLSNAPNGTIPTAEGTNFGTATSINFTNGVSDANIATLIAYKSESASVDVTDGTIDSNGNASYDIDLTVNHGTANNLNFVQQPTNTLVNTTITPSVTVEVRDAWNNILTDSNTTNITISIDSNPGAGSLSGILSQTASNGVATFNDVSIGKPGTGYTLKAISGALNSATSNSFDVAFGAVILESQSSSSLVLRISLPGSQQLVQYRINTFDPIGSVYFYHPLVETDMSAFDQFILEIGAYEFIDGAINLSGHDALLNLFKQLKSLR